MKSLGDISGWIYNKPAPKAAPPDTCCCRVKTEDEEELDEQLHPHAPAIITVIGSPDSQRTRVVQHVANQFGAWVCS